MAKIHNLIVKYENRIDSLKLSQMTPLMRQQITDYRQFVADLRKMLTK